MTAYLKHEYTYLYHVYIIYRTRVKQYVDTYHRYHDV